MNKMKKTILAFALLGLSCAFAGEKQYLWKSIETMPDYQPQQVGALTDEMKAPGYKPDDYRIPYIEWLEKPANPNGGIVLLISGGAYWCCCDVGLVRDSWPKKFTAAGFQCVVLAYRTGRPNGLKIHQSAWEDGQRAVRLVRSEAAKRGFNPENIGAISMSAGSHLNVLLATSSLTPAYAKVDELDDIPCHLNWAVTGAIAYGVTDGYGVPNSRMGSGPGTAVDPAFKFDKKSAPMCMLHGGEDPYSPTASTLVYRELRKHGVPAEIHLYGGHGHGGFWSENWWESVAGFLRQLNLDGKLGPEVSLDERFKDVKPAVAYSKEDVWPKGGMPDVQTNQCTPYIEWYIPSNLTTKAIQIIYSGGGYNGNGPHSFEVAPTRKFLNSKGMTVVTMKYRTPRPINLPKHITAWQDLQRAIRIVRTKAPTLGLDPNRIGIMGSSAGGHLTLMGALSSRQLAYYPTEKTEGVKGPAPKCNVQWAIGIYPAYALTGGENGYNKHGGNLDEDMLVPEFNFDLDTPPMCFIHGDADGYSAMGSVKVWEKMRLMGIQSDLHTLVKRPHCFHRTAAEGTGSYSFLNRIWEFLTKKGFNK